MINQVSWIVQNHPHEMVYFNEIGREYAAEFDRDYWHLSEIEGWRYISEHDDSEVITVNTSGYQFFTYMLKRDEVQRIEFSENPKYFIETYRSRIGNDYKMEGYEEYYSKLVDGFKVFTVFKKEE